MVKTTGSETTIVEYVEIDIDYGLSIPRVEVEKIYVIIMKVKLCKTVYVLCLCGLWGWLFIRNGKQFCVC